MTISAIAIFIAVLALLVAGFAKGISGMGLPVVATPVLTLLFDLQTAIAITIVPALLTDIIMLIRTPKNWGLIKNAASLMMFGMCGIVVGSYALVRIHPSILSAVLGVIILLFVGTFFFAVFPAIKQRRRLDAAVGFIAGTAQGAAGASGPIISMYMLQMKMSRDEFLFMINSFFVTIDVIQLMTVYKLGLYHGPVIYYSIGAIVPALLALAAAFALQKKISDQVFRYSVLIMMTLSASALLFKSIQTML
ncbi:sulfite exporter TauE/SafE family protein [Paenibacillus naphthalenovorans]|uniref:sulfite exporter TauE/SafE family protein n=1 Tax=Paenibacillus naphthalenovorans TaxID=162209 RepID=UPI003D2D497B